MKDGLFSGLEAFHVYPIGSIHRGEASMYLGILPTFRLTLKQLEHFSYITVLFWAHEHVALEVMNAIDLQVEPPYAPGMMTGIFAARSVLWLNPILSTPCVIAAIGHDQGMIHINRNDGIDGAPILDIKGYFPVMDRDKDAVIPKWLDWGIDHVEETGLDLYEELGSA